MAINVKNLIGRVRAEITMDTDEADYRWSDGTMVDFANQTVYELLKHKKHLLINPNTGLPSRSDDVVSGVTLSDIETATYALPSHYEETIMHGTACRCFLSDATDQANAARAGYERSRFYECAGIAVAQGSSNS